MNLRGCAGPPGGHFTGEEVEVRNISEMNPIVGRPSQYRGGDRQGYTRKHQLPYRWHR